MSRYLFLHKRLRSRLVGDEHVDQFSLQDSADWSNFIGIARHAHHARDLMELFEVNADDAVI